MKTGHELMWYTCEFRRNRGGLQQQQRSANRTSMAGRCYMPILFSIDNRPCIHIYIRVNTCEYS